MIPNRRTMRISDSYFFFSAWKYSDNTLVDGDWLAETVKPEATAVGSYWKAWSWKKENKFCQKSSGQSGQNGRLLYIWALQRSCYVFPFILRMDSCDLGFRDSEGAGLVVETWEVNLLLHVCIFSTNKTNFLDPGIKMV